MTDETLDRDLKKALVRGAATRCPGEEALVRFYRGDMSDSDSDAIREHLATCASCVELARDARAFVAAMSGADGAAMSGADVAAMQGSGPEVMSMSRAKRWLAVAAVLAAAAIFLVWLARHSPVSMPEARVEAPVAAAPRSWKELPIVVAPYAPAPEDELVFRSDEPPGSRGFAEVMAPYARGDYARSEALLARYLLAHPNDGRASFYRGVSLLLIGRPEEALPLLEAAAESGPPPDGARWYLALAQLRSGNEDAALRELDAIAGAEGAHQREAAELAKEVRSARDARRR